MRAVLIATLVILLAAVVSMLHGGSENRAPLAPIAAPAAPPDSTASREAADTGGDDDRAESTIAHEVAKTVKSGAADRQRVEAAQAESSPTLVAYEKLVDLHAHVNGIALEAMTCGLRSRQWQMRVVQRADDEMRNGELPSDLRSKMTIDEVFAAEAYREWMKPFHNPPGKPTLKECEGIFGVAMTASGPHEFFANKVDRYSRGEGLLFENLD